MAVTFPFLSYIGQETSVLAERDVFPQLARPRHHAPPCCRLSAFNVSFCEGGTSGRRRRQRRHIERDENKQKHCGR